MSARQRSLGLLALVVAIICFSLGSTIVKKAGIPGPALSFWRMILTTVLWWSILWFTEHRIVTWAEIKRAALPGFFFGINITVFFTGVTRTSVANAELIGSLTPIILVPAGAILFKERINGRALWFALVSFVGLILVLFNAPSGGAASWGGNLIVALATILWAAYLLVSRQRRGSMSVQTMMAALMPTAALAAMPLGLFRGELDDVTWNSIPYMILLALMTGTLAHGLVIFSQHSVPVSTMSLMQVTQPALAVLWAYLLLGQTLRPIQLVGVAMVMAGIAAVVTITRRGTEGTRRGTEGTRRDTEGTRAVGSEPTTRGARRIRRAERVAAAADPRT